MGFLGGALGVVLNPLGKAMDWVGDAIGIPPIVQSGVKTVVGAVTGNVMLAADGIAGTVKALTQHPPAVTVYCPPSDPRRAEEGWAPSCPPEPVPAQGCPPPSSAPGRHLDPKLGPYLDSLKTFEQNLAYLDSLSGKKDGRLTQENLLRITESREASAPLREAASFLLRNPAYFTVLESSGSFKFLDWTTPLQDGAFNAKNLRAEIGRVEALFEARGMPPAQLPTQPDAPCPPRERGARSILDDPRLSTEDKIQALLSGAAQSADQEILGVLEDMSGEREQRAQLGDSKEDRSKAAQLDSSMEQLNLRLQRLVEKRKQMFELMSTLSQKFNEMAKTAIQNVGRA